MLSILPDLTIPSFIIYFALCSKVSAFQVVFASSLSLFFIAPAFTAGLQLHRWPAPLACSAGLHLPLPLACCCWIRPPPPPKDNKVRVEETGLVVHHRLLLDQHLLQVGVQVGEWSGTFSHSILNHIGKRCVSKASVC